MANRAARASPASTAITAGSITSEKPIHTAATLPAPAASKTQPPIASRRFTRAGMLPQNSRLKPIPARAQTATPSMSRSRPDGLSLKIGTSASQSVQNPCFQTNAADSAATPAKTGTAPAATPVNRPASSARIISATAPIPRKA